MSPFVHLGGSERAAAKQGKMSRVIRGGSVARYDSNAAMTSAGRYLEKSTFRCLAIFLLIDSALRLDTSFRCEKISAGLSPPEACKKENSITSRTSLGVIS